MQLPWIRYPVIFLELLFFLVQILDLLVVFKVFTPFSHQVFRALPFKYRILQGLRLISSSILVYVLKLVILLRLGASWSRSRWIVLRDIRVLSSSVLNYILRPWIETWFLIWINWKVRTFLLFQIFVLPCLVLVLLLIVTWLSRDLYLLIWVILIRILLLTRFPLWFWVFLDVTS